MSIRTILFYQAVLLCYETEASDSDIQCWTHIVNRTAAAGAYHGTMRLDQQTLNLWTLVSQAHADHYNKLMTDHLMKYLYINASSSGDRLTGRSHQSCMQSTAVSQYMPQPSTGQQVLSLSLCLGWLPHHCLYGRLYLLYGRPGREDDQVNPSDHRDC